MSPPFDLLGAYKDAQKTTPLILVPSYDTLACINDVSEKMSGPVLARTDFSQISMFVPPIFLRILSPDIFSSCLWEISAQKTPLGESLTKSPKTYTAEIPNVCAEGWTKRCSPKVGSR